jgi:hypothetical protein
MSQQLEKVGFYWTDKDKEAFALDYFQTGNIKETATTLGIPYDTAKAFTKQDWCVETLSRYRVEANRAMDKKISTLIDKAFTEMEDRLDNGEERVLKNGQVVRVKPGLAAITIAAGTMFDKRQLLRKAPTQDATTDDILVRLAEKLREFASPTPVTIEAEEVQFKE